MATHHRSKWRIWAYAIIFLIFSVNVVAGDQTNGNNSGCDMCAGLHGNGTLPNTIPTDPPLNESQPSEGTCVDWGTYLLESVPKESSDCIKFTQTLAHQCCDLSNMKASYICESNLKEKLLGDNSSYANTAIPVPAGEEQLNVTVSLSFWHILSISTVEGTAEIFFSIFLYWRDERLTWDPAKHDGCLDMAVRASLDPELTEIYVPDFNLLNRIDGVEKIPVGQASVRADGNVVWERNGVLKGVCAYDGLESIPFDTLSCSFIFGSEVNRNDRKIRYIFGDGDPDTPGLIFANFPSKYQEFSLKSEQSRTFDYVDVVVPGQSLTYEFHFERADHYYITKIVVPAILFTFMSFGMFLLDQRVGERLSFGVALLLVMVTNSIVTADMLPITEHVLWIDTFALASYYWVIIGVLESVFVAYLYYQHGEEEVRRDEEKHRLMEEYEKELEEQRESEACAVKDDTYIDNSLDTTTNLPGPREHASSRNNDESVRSSASDNHSPRTLLSLLLQRETTAWKWRVRFVHRLDRFCLIVLPLTYIVFIITMFATASSWG